MKPYKISSPIQSNKPGQGFGSSSFGGPAWNGNGIVSSGIGQPATISTNWRSPPQMPGTTTGPPCKSGPGGLQRLASTPNQSAMKSANISKVGFPPGKKKKGGNPPSSTNTAHNILEPLVELRPTSNHVYHPKVEKPQTSTFKYLQAQLAKSHKKSQKLNLIRNADTTSNYFPGFYEPTQAQILEAENRKNEALLQIYTDSGTFSKVVAMTVAASVLDTKLPYDVVQYPLDIRKKEELTKFCHDISLILGIPDMKSLDSNDYRRLWHLFSIFTNAMDQRICSDPARSNNVPEPNALNNNNASSLNNNSRSSYQSMTPKRKLEETSSDTEIIETIKTFNPTLYHALKDPLERFLIVYGRYVDVGQVNKSSNLKHNVLNEHISRYHERVAFNLPTQASPFKHSNGNTMHSDKSGKNIVSDPKNMSATNSYLEKANQQHQQFQHHAPNTTRSPGMSDSTESRGSTAESTGDKSWGSLQDNESLDGHPDDKENQRSSEQLNSSRHAIKGHKKNDLRTKKKRGPVPSWVQAYHRSPQIEPEPLDPVSSLAPTSFKCAGQASESPHVLTMLKTAITGFGTPNENGNGEFVSPVQGLRKQVSQLIRVRNVRRIRKMNISTENEPDECLSSQLSDKPGNFEMSTPAVKSIKSIKSIRSARIIEENNSTVEFLVPNLKYSERTNESLQELKKSDPNLSLPKPISIPCDQNENFRSQNDEMQFLHKPQHQRVSSNSNSIESKEYVCVHLSQSPRHWETPLNTLIPFHSSCTIIENTHSLDSIIQPSANVIKSKVVKKKSESDCVRKTSSIFTIKRCQKLVTLSLELQQYSSCIIKPTSKKTKLKIRRTKLNTSKQTTKKRSTKTKVVKKEIRSGNLRSKMLQDFFLLLMSASPSPNSREYHSWFIF